MLNAEDVARMIATASAIRGDREISVVLVRGNQPLPAQPVRLTILNNRPVMRANAQADQATASVLMRGAVDMDVQRGDRFRHDGVDYTVDMVRPDRTIETVAEVRVLA